MKGAPGSGPGFSVLEELFNKGKLKPDSYRQLIHTLVRERNAFRDSSKSSEKEIVRLRQLVAETGNTILMLQRELRTLQSFIKH